MKGLAMALVRFTISGVFFRRLALGGVLVAAVLCTAAPAFASTTYELSAFAGTGTAAAPTAGSATSSDLQYPYGLAVDGSGNVYIADTDNNAVEKVTPSGQLSVIAGTGNAGPPTVGLATSSDLREPFAVAVDAAGNVYIADTDGAYVEKVTPTGQLSIIAGDGTSSGTPTQGSATATTIGNPSGIAVDSAGNIYIADQTNSRVYKVTPSGQLSFFAGTGNANANAGSGDQLGLD